MKTKFPASKVSVVRLYEVQCDECGGNIGGGEFYDTRVEAEVSRKLHVAYHRSYPEESEDLDN